MNRAGRVALVLAMLALALGATGCTSPSERNAALPSVDEGAILKKQARDDLARYDQAVAKAAGGQVVVTPPRVDPDNPPRGEHIGTATVTADGMGLAVAFEGSMGCGIDYRGEAAEGANAVVVIVTGRSKHPGGICAGAGAVLAATVTLTRPLGERAVLDVVDGMPVGVQTSSPPFEESPVLKRQAHDYLARYDKAFAKAKGGKVHVTPQPLNSAPPGVRIDSALLMADETRLTVAFRAADGPATVPCGGDYSADAVEGADAVVVILTVHLHGTGETCPQVGFHRAAPLTLAHPLGKRAVLEGVWGLPVPVITAS